MRLVITFFLVCSIFRQAYAQQSSPTRTLRLDPESSRGGTASEVFESVSYIPLETTKESTFGDVSELTVTDQYFIIYDRDTDCILIFRKNGKFHGRIKSSDVKGTVAHSVIIQDKKEILIKKWVKNELHYLYYDYNAKKLREEPVKNKNTNMHMFPSGRVAYYKYSVDERLRDSVSHELTYSAKDKTLAVYFPYNMKSEAIKSRDVLSADHDPFYKTGNDSSVLFCRSYEYGIYQLTAGSVARLYDFVFPLNNTLPAFFAKDTSLSGRRINYLKANPDIIYSVSYPYLLGDNLFFKLFKYKYDPNTSFIYNLRSNNLISLKHITPDSLTSYLPVVDDGVEFNNKNFITGDGVSLYTAYSSLTMFAAYKNIGDKKAVFDERMKQYFNTGNNKQNPVIVQMTPKKGL